MNKEEYIVSRFKKILRENINEKSESILNQLNYDKEVPFNPAGEAFDYVQEGETCESCGGEMTEGECMECGMRGSGEVMERKNKSKFSMKDIEDLLGDIKDDMGKDDEDDYRDLSMYNPYHGDKNFDFDNEEDMVDEDIYEIELGEELYGNQSRIDKNKNGKIDREDFKMLRKQQDEEEQLYEIEFEKEETYEGNAFTGALSKAKKHHKDEFEVDGKKYKVKESILYTESDLIDIIEKIVNEEKKFKVEEPKGYREYERAHKADKKENDDYLKSVAKKMTDYLKGASDSGSKYEMKETQKFPTENGGMKKGNRKKYTPSDAVDEYIDAFSYPGQTNLVYDEIKPNDKNIEKYLKGHRTTGNAQVDDDGNALGNVVPSDVGEKFFKNFKDNLYGQEQMSASYKRQPQPVDQAGEHTERGSLKSRKGKKTSQSILNKVDESTDLKKVEKLNEEFDRINNLMSYNRKTQ
jgi:hypothetical protein